MQRKAFDVSSDGYPRAASVALLSEFSRLAKGYANEMVTQAGIKKGSPEWFELFPKDGSATYKPSDADLDYLIPIAETSASRGVEFYEEVSPDIPGWICQQVKLAIGSHTMIRDCLRMSALSGYLSRFVVEEEEQQEDD